MPRKISVEIVGDSRSLERAFRRSEVAATGFQSKIERANRGRDQLFRAGVAGIGVASVFRGISKVTQAASDLNEEVSKSEQIFGDSANEVRAWSKTTTDAFGISQRAALQAASGFGAMLQTSGLTEAASARMSQALTELGGDLASFYNLTTDEALTKLRSGLAGEAEPLRVLGVQLSEAAVQNEAYATGLAKVGSKLTEGEKVRARYLLIMKQTAKAQGDAARTGDQLAGQQRRLAARTEDLEAAAGGKLLPTITDLATVAGELARQAQKLNQQETPDDGGGGWRGLSVLKFATSAYWVHKAADAVRELRGEMEKPIAPLQFDTSKILTSGLATGAKKIPGFGEPGFKPGGAPPVPVTTVEQRNQWWDAMIGRREDRVQDIRSLSGQLTEWRRIAALIRERIAITKDITRRATLGDLLRDVERNERSVMDAIRSGAAQARAAARALAEQLAENRRLARNAAQYEALGLTGTGEERVPGARLLRRQLDRIATAVAGTPMAAKLKARLAGVRRVLSGELGVVGRDVRAKIREILNGIDEELKQHSDRSRRFRQINAKAFIDRLGLDLTLVQKRRLEAVLATLGPNMTVPANRSLAYSGAGGVTVHNVNLYGVQDMAAFETQLVKRTSSRSHPRRGAR